MKNSIPDALVINLMTALERKPVYVCKTGRRLAFYAVVRDRLECMMYEVPTRSPWIGASIEARGRYTATLSIGTANTAPLANSGAWANPGVYSLSIR